MRAFLGTVEGWATKVKLHIQAAIGEGAEAANAKAILAGKSVDDLAKKQSVAAADAMAKSKQAAAQDIVDLEKKKKNFEKFIQEKRKLEDATFKLETKNVTQLEQIEALSKKRKLMAERAHQAALLQIRARADLTALQKGQLEVAENGRFNQEKQAQAQAESDFKIKLLDDYASHATTVQDGITRAFAANTAKMKAEQEDMGKRGQEIWNSMSANATSALTNMGGEMAKGKDIASATADAMRAAFLGFLGDRAIAEGTVTLLSGIGTFNPVAIASGSALIVLGGALKGLAGAGASPSTAVSSPSIQATASGSAPRLEPVTSTEPKETPGAPDMSESGVPASPGKMQRTVQVNIAGNYLETDQTRRMLMDLMRQESDSTGFAYNQIGA
jgi:hypothetical protein